VKPNSNSVTKSRSLFSRPLVKWSLVLACLSAILALAWIFGRPYFGINQIAYRTVTIEEGPLTATIRASGTLNPVRSVTVGTGVSGMIRELNVDFNDRVRQGQVIAQIDQREFKAKFDQAQANYDLALKNHEYNVRLQKEGFISQQALVGTEGVLKAALGALNLAKKSLDDTEIRSPVDGVVVKRSVEVGQTVAASLQSPEIFVIARNLAEMQVETSIDESDVGRIEEGFEATFTVDAFPGRIFRGKVKQVRKSPVNIQNVVTYTVLISANNPDFKLLPGMTANARIIIERNEKALKVANTALRFRMPAQTSTAEKKSSTNKPAAADSPQSAASSGTSRGSRGTGMAGNLRSVYVLEQDGRKQTPIRKSFRLGITDGEYSQILPLKEGEEVDLKVGDLVIIGIEGQTGVKTPATGGAPRMF